MIVDSEGGFDCRCIGRACRRRRRPLTKMEKRWRNLKYSMVVLAMLSVYVLGRNAAENNLKMTVSSQDVDFLLSETKNITFSFSNQTMMKDLLAAEDEVTVTFELDHSGILHEIPDITVKDQGNFTVTISAIKAGHVTITTNTTSPGIDTSQSFVRVVVMKSKPLYWTSFVVGWIYFVAWTVSFYPQIIENFRRKSVIGLNFDFLGLNIVGFTLYGCFNVGLYFFTPIQDDYFSKHPTGVNPVQLNDVIFTLHAIVACVVTIVQCIIYERGSQKMSKICMGILGGIAIFITISLILSFTAVISWLDFLYYCSYVKLGITLIKYIPQAYMNFRRKSTSGWSIGNVILDFTGGSLSILQMFLISYNNDDWGSIFGDPTKFGLGLFSVLFDILFILQHYVFYSGNLPHEELAGSNRDENSTSDVEEDLPPDC